MTISKPEVDSMQKVHTLIIGGGPAGLTAAYELAAAGTTDVLVVEASGQLGGLSQTIDYKGNRIDIGGHRFFSKSDWVMDWWLRMLPLADGQDGDAAARGLIRGRKVKRVAATETSAMLIRKRLSRILHGGRFFDYPLKPDVTTVLKLGLPRTLRYGISYAWSHLFQRRPEKTLEDFFVNRFGYQLYLKFFKDYTEKVWGRTCDSISAEWGAQRVKSLSVIKALAHALRKALKPDGSDAATHTSLIERFLYPALGPGSMWETTAQRFVELGGQVRLSTEVVGLRHHGGRLAGVTVCGPDDKEYEIAAEHVISSMPVKDLIERLGTSVPADVREVAAGLEYRDFMIVGLLYDRMIATEASLDLPNNLVPDNWIYVQEPDVKVGRLQIYNNWSPFMVADPCTVWVGMEFFCQEGDALWNLADCDLLTLAAGEMKTLGLAEPKHRLDGVVIRMPKAYPGYYGAYERFDRVRAFVDGLENLFLVGRNGMHRYNNQDHSMLSAKRAAELIIAGSTDKSSIWDINVDDEYHEERAAKELAET